jgi:hypothetical protein
VVPGKVVRHERGKQKATVLSATVADVGQSKDRTKDELQAHSEEASVPENGNWNSDKDQHRVRLLSIGMARNFMSLS